MTERSAGSRDAEAETIELLLDAIAPEIPESATVSLESLRVLRERFSSVERH